MVSYIRKQGGTGSVPLYPSYSRGTAPGAGRKDHSSGQTLSRRSDCSGRPALQDEQNSAHGMDPPPVSVQCTMHHMEHTQSGLVATRLNNRLPVFVSPMADPIAVDIDAMSMAWKGMYAYVFPSSVMLGRVLEKVFKDHPREMVLVAPKWPNQYWHAKLFALLVAFSLVLPLTADLLFQSHNHQRRRSLPAVCIHAWRLSSDPLQREGFRRQLSIRSHAVVGNPPELSMTANGGSSLVGVLGNRWIRSRLLFRILADFFVFIFQVKHFNPRTTKGYRSDISSTISSCGSRTELSNFQELSSLIRSFQLERPLQRKLAPSGIYHWWYRR